MMPDRNNYVPDNVVILYRLCTVCQMDAHNLSVRSVDSPGQMRVQNYEIRTKSFCVDGKKFRF